MEFLGIETSVILYFVAEDLTYFPGVHKTSALDWLLQSQRTVIQIFLGCGILKYDLLDLGTRAGLSGISEPVYTTCARKSIHLHQFKNIVCSSYCHSSLLCKSYNSVYDSLVSMVRGLTAHTPTFSKFNNHNNKVSKIHKVHPQLRT